MDVFSLTVVGEYRLHTYRGRQGADVALLVRRVRERLSPEGLQCIGTSATMASGDSVQEKNRALAGVATKLFADEVSDNNIALRDAAFLRPWLSRLLDLGLVQQTGRTRAARYFVPAELLRHVGLDGQTTLTRIQPHRLRALILEDLERFPDSGRVDIHRRIGPEIHEKTVVRALNELVDEGRVCTSGVKRWRTYRLAQSHGQEP